MNPREYWNKKIIEWENSSYCGPRASVSLIERVAAGFRRPIQRRRDVLLGMLKDSVKGKVVLELGCGSGGLCFEFLKLGAAKVIGIDISDKAVKAAREASARLGLSGKTEFLTADINSNPAVPDADFTVGLGFIDYIDIDALKKLFAEIKGKFIFSFPEKKVNLINVLQYAYLKSQGCAKFYKFDRKEFDAVKSPRGRCGFFTKEGMTFIANFDPLADNTSTALSLDIIIPARNEEASIGRCLEAVFRQDYPREKLKVTVADGESTDSTAAIARTYGCEVILNRERLAEAGVRRGIADSAADIRCVLAVDNIIAGDRDFFRNLVRPFSEQGVTAVFPLVVYGPGEPAINKYITERAEPFSEFIYMNACNTRTFNKVYPVIFKNEYYTIFDFKDRMPPLLALAQGFAFRREVLNGMSSLGAYDLSPIMELIRKGGRIAYVDSARIYHHQIMGMKAFVKKFKWRIKRNLAAGPQEKVTHFFSSGMRIRWVLWPFYSVSLIGPLAYSLFCCLKNRKWFYLYHFICNTVLFFLVIQEYLMGGLRGFSRSRGVGTYK